MTREERIAAAFNAAPKNSTEERECLALGVTVMVNADMLKMLHEDNATLREELKSCKTQLETALSDEWAKALAVTADDLTDKLELEAVKKELASLRRGYAESIEARTHV